MRLESWRVCSTSRSPSDAVHQLRLALVFFGARQGAGFNKFRNATEPFYVPFKGLFASSLVLGHVVEWSLLVAMLAYAVLHAGIRGLLRLLVRA